jgi:hypothetical protein
MDTTEHTPKVYSDDEILNAAKEAGLTSLYNCCALAKLLGVSQEVVATVMVEKYHRPIWRLEDEAREPRVECLLLKPAHLKGKPQKGKNLSGSWFDFIQFFGKSQEGDPGLEPNKAKVARGGWAGGHYQGGHRAGKALNRTQLMALDIDRGGDIDRASDALASFRKVIHSTYKSTPENPRCRVVLMLSEPITDPKQYKIVYKTMVDAMIRAGYVEGDVDRAASDVSRLNYFPMHQRGIEPRCVVTDGNLVDVPRILRVAAETAKLVQRRRANVITLGKARGPNYIAACIRNAREEMEGAREGERHTTLFKKAAGLAKVGVANDADIVDALLPIWIRKGGEEAEGLRVLNDAIDAGRGG